MITESGDSAPPSSQNQTSRPHYKASWARVKKEASGRWPEIHNALIPAFNLDCVTTKKKGFPCPNCGGDDRFHYTDEDRGCWYCRHCANTLHGFPDGFNLIAICNNITDSEAKDLVGDYLGLNGEESKPQTQIKKNIPLNQKQKIEKISPTASEIKATALRILANCDKGLPEYLSNKGITTTDHEVNRCHFSLPNSKRFVPQGAWVIPIQNINNPSETISVQYIPKDGKIKYHLTGFKKEHGIIVMRGDDSSPYIVIGTGAATCYRVFKIMGYTTISAFDDAGMVKSCPKIASLFPNKKVIILGDNDTHKGHTKGQEAAYKAASLINGFAIIPDLGDWDDYGKAYGDEATKSEIIRQLCEFRDPIIINDKVAGISINHSILLNNMTGVSFSTALSHYIGMQCRCPISGGRAIINTGSIYSFDEKKIIVPILAALHDEELITECRDLKKISERVVWANHYALSQKHLYALIWVLGGRFGADILEYKDFERLLEKYRGCSAFSGELELKHLHNQDKIVISPEIHDFIQYLLESKVKQAAKLWELNFKKFKHYREVKQQNHGRIDWQPTVDEIIAGHHSIIAVQAIHGQGKTEDLAYKTSREITPVIYMTHRAKLVAQACDVLKLFHYQDDKKTIQMAGYVNGLACCTPSFKHEINLNHIRRAKLIIIDEFIQWFSDLLTNKKCIDHLLPSKLRSALQESISKGCKIVLLDADLTTKGIQQFMRFLNVENDDILLVVVENPKREHTSMISISTARAHYQTRAIKSMENNLEQFQPFLVAVESEAAAHNLYDKFRKNYPESHIVLLTGNKCLIQKNGLEIISKSKIFIDKINDNLLTVDALIYTNVIGTGVSINHHNQRFKKCYGLFGGWVLSPMDAIQMIKRGRNVTDFYIGLLCHPFDLYMTSFYKDIGSISWLKLSSDSDDIDKISAEIEFIKNQSATVFISALLGLLRDKHKFSVTIDQPAEDKIDDLKSTEELVKEYQQRLIASKPHPSLEQALSLQMDEYRNDEERFSCEAKICMDYYNMTAVTVEAAELWFNPAKKVACDRLELIVRILRSDPDLTVKNPKMQRDILIKSGVTLELITSRILSQEEIIRFRDLLAAHCDLLVGLRLIPERYVKSSAISIIKPIVPVQKILNYIGINAVTIRKEGGRELEISVPTPMVSRLQLAIKLTKKQEEESLKAKALAMHSEGKGHKMIAKELNLKNKDKARRLLGK